MLKLDAKNVKGLFRRGQARIALQKLELAQSGTLVVLSAAPYDLGR